MKNLKLENLLSLLDQASTPHEVELISFHISRLLRSGQSGQVSEQMFRVGEVGPSIQEKENSLSQKEVKSDVKTSLDSLFAKKEVEKKQEEKTGEIPNHEKAIISNESVNDSLGIAILSKVLRDDNINKRKTFDELNMDSLAMSFLIAELKDSGLFSQTLASNDKNKIGKMTVEAFANELKKQQSSNYWLWVRSSWWDI